MSGEKLKACPFCGSAEHLNVFDWFTDDYEGKAIECRCGCMAQLATWQGPRVGECIAITKKGENALARYRLSGRRCA